MQLSVLLMLELPALSSASGCHRKDKSVLLMDSFNIAQTNLEWKTFNGHLFDGAISIDNRNVRSTDYVCQYKDSTGFYRPGIDSTPSCHFPWRGVENIESSFQILVNKDDFEILEWKRGSNGSVPQNSIKIQCNEEIYVGKQGFTLGKVDVENRLFYFSLRGSESSHVDYEVLTFSKDVYSEHLSDVKYETDGVKIITYPPETVRKSVITNKDCTTVKGTATLSKTNQVQNRWDSNFSFTLGAQASITAGIPIIASTNITYSIEKTLQFTNGTAYTVPTTHTVHIEVNVPSNHFCSISLVGDKYEADIPYTARVSRTYSNGETRQTSISGTYKGVQMGVMKVVDRCEPLPNAVPCLDDN